MELKLSILLGAKSTQFEKNNEPFSLTIFKMATIYSFLRRIHEK